VGDGMIGEAQRGSAGTSLWSADCKDCRAERAAQVRPDAKMKSRAARGQGASFEYSGSWARRKLDRGESRSDRCERHRRSHASAIGAFAVPYLDLKVIAQVADPEHPTGPLGGLGPLPVLHREKPRITDLAEQPFGMTDADILSLLSGLAEKRVAVVEAGTGTGKSTFMPFRLMNPPEGAAYRPTDFGPIVVTEPRRVAATGVARFVGEDLCYDCDSRKCARHVGPGFQVGYQVRGERHWDAACDLIYVTDGTMINWVRDGQLARMSMVIIDEAHERSENIDIILAQLRELLRQHEHLRVVIASATLDREFFISYFGGPERVFQHNIPATKSFGYGTPLFIGADINEAVLEKGMSIAPGLEFTGWPQDTSAEWAGEDLRRTTRELSKLRCVGEIVTTEWRNEMPEAVVRQVVAIARGTRWGDILAFLPTAATIEDTVGRIRSALEELDLAFDVYPLLASTPKATSEKAIAARSRGDRRRIVISSNLAETSLTVKGVRFVVDSGLICQEEWDSRLASGSFPVKPHSQSALRQRWGRVGRDMPGWVFPLYTVEQFLSLARNTPPETSQKNLETHYMKLLSSGLDPGAMTLPGSHVSEGAEIDRAGREYIDQFERESARARQALAAAGAIDGDGHLTEFGREVERYSGDGASALAIMLADQLACAHEVILALTVLGAGQLAGNRAGSGKADFILAVDESWPAAWRVRAAQAHRGLAFGCRDELDVLLRVVALYQSVPDRKAWCARWWVNSAMVDSAIEEMMEQVDALSAAMKEDAVRAVMPELGGRARAVLSRALVSARFRRSADGHFLPAREGEPEPAKLGANVLVEAPEQILALNRFRRGRVREDGRPRPAEISHIVEFLPWAALPPAGAADLGLDLIVRVAEQPEQSPAVDNPFALAVLEAIPIGSIWDFDFGANGTVTDSDPVAPSFDLPFPRMNKSSAGAGDRAVSGFDREWDPRRERLGETPAEERALEILKAQAAEVNDDIEAEPAEPSRSVGKLDLSGRLYGRASAGTALEGKVRGVVVGYGSAAGGKAVLLIDPLDPDFVPGDPADHADVIPWEEIRVVVGRMTSDHQTPFLQLDRADRRGSFFLPDWGSAPEMHDRGFVGRLRTGALLTARVVPAEPSATSVTLLPAARSVLGRAEVETRPRGEERLRVFSASLVEDVDETGWGTVEIDHRDDATGMSFRFRVHRNVLSGSSPQGAAAGMKLLIGLRPAREDRRKAAAPERPGRSILKAPSDEIAEIAAAQPALEVKGRRIRAGQRDIPFAVISRLIDASPDLDWRRDVWAFYEQSLHLSVSAAYPPSPRVELPVRIASLIQFRKDEFEARLGVSLFVRRREASVGIGSADPNAILRATKALQELAELPRLSVRIGSEKVGSRAVEARHDVSYVWIEDGVATIIGASHRSVEDAMRQLVKPARGEIMVPQHWIGRFVGTGGVNLRAYQAASGCDAHSPLKDGRWQLRAPAAANVERFLALATAKIPAAVGTLVDRGELARVSDPARPSPTVGVTAWRNENPHFFADVALTELERLAGVKSQLRPILVADAVPSKPGLERTGRSASTPASGPTLPPLRQSVAPPRMNRPATQKADAGGLITRLFRKLFD
jgi:HrpA-like RNA helicase